MTTKKSPAADVSLRPRRVGFSSWPAAPPPAPDAPAAQRHERPADSDGHRPLTAAAAPAVAAPHTGRAAAAGAGRLRTGDLGPFPRSGSRTDLTHLGLEENGSLKVPQDTGNGAPASWYNGSPTPGERGPSVMLGHVNALGGHTGVFADLRKLKPGDQISVTRADGSTAVFTVYRGALYTKNSFPTLEVYGNTTGSELRLITCDGYDPATGEFDDNYVIYAKLTT